MESEEEFVVSGGSDLEDAVTESGSDLSDTSSDSSVDNSYSESDNVLTSARVWCKTNPVSALPNYAFEDAYKKIMDSLKKLDIVINNAAIANDKEWELAVATNLVGLIHSSLLAFQYMSKESGGGGGIVLNISSTAGLIGKDAYPMHSAVKHGVVGYSRSMGLPYHEERTGVKVMTLCPGPTQTQLLVGMTTSTLDSSWQDHFSDTLADMQVQKPEDVAEAMLHILANGKSGSVWVCEGGKPVYEVVIPHYEKMKA